MSTKRKAAPSAPVSVQPCTKLEFLEVLRAACPPECEFDDLPARISLLGICVRMKLGGLSFVGETALVTRDNAVRMADHFHQAVQDVAKKL